MSDREVRVRFAPSPTGPLHMGGVRTALYNYLFAKKHGGTFILRIEDTDQARYVPGAEEYIIESLRWCGIAPDEGQDFGGSEGPYRQSERKHLYREYVDQLIENGHAYYAFDTSEELENMRELAKKAGNVNWQYNHITRGRMKNSLSLSADEVQKRLDSGEPYVVRIKFPRNHEVKFEDQIRGWVSVNTNNMDDKVLFKSDGMPTYHMANIVDDHLMRISHVIRGEEWLPSAPLHVLLYEFLGWERPEFAHLPLLLKPDGNGKLSKRDGDRLGFPVFPLEWKNPETGEMSSGYRERGFFPEAFVNMLAFLGWNPGTNQEIFSLEGLVEAFEISKVSKAGAKFDFEKAKWFNQQYLRAKDNSELAEQLKPILDAKGVDYSKLDLPAIVELMKERATFIPDLYEEGKYFFERPASYDEKSVSKKWTSEAPGYIHDLMDRFAHADPFREEILENSFKAYLQEKELGFGQVGPVLRIAITGQVTGPSAFAISEILGREEVIARMELATEKLG
ncbi:MAG: glutamate--tRNA ligase [Bacteroidota bacterium]|nr:glutamate--tRNA ligase [Bacteroidota bacterium]MDX5506392.1 glutamate--tRNA ligase [Bacteroidota bacterium]